MNVTLNWNSNRLSYFELNYFFLFLIIIFKFQERISAKNNRSNSEGSRTRKPSNEFSFKFLSRKKQAPGYEKFNGRKKTWVEGVFLKSLQSKIVEYSVPWSNDHLLLFIVTGGGGGGGGGPDSSGWTTVTNSQPNKSRLVVESSKLKLEQSDVEVASTLSLGNR